MSFSITTYVREGIVMAADSRLSLNNCQQNGQNSINLISISQSDSNRKLFVTKNNVGIASVGAADIKGVPIAGFIDEFINLIVSDNQWSPENIADEIIKYFNSQIVIPDTQFHIAGYENTGKDQQIVEVNILHKTKKLIKQKDQFGASWQGETDVLARLLNPSAEIDILNGNKIKNIYPNVQIPFDFFTLQDAIDFSVYAVKTTIDTIRFQPRPKTVGGPIDVLVIHPDNSIWIQHKELSVK
jgi:hypothetical protein